MMFVQTKESPVLILRNRKREKFDNDHKLPSIFPTHPSFVFMSMIYVRYQYTTWRLSCVSGYGLSCSAPITNTSVTQVVPSPSAITPSAASASVGVNISNSSVTPANQNSSITENGTDTREYAPLLQYFMLTSSVVFIRVPSVKPQPVKR